MAFLRWTCILLLALAQLSVAAEKNSDQVFDTSIKFKDKNGQYVVERQKLHERIVIDALKQGQTSDHPILMYTAGPPGAGKSSILKSLEESGLIATSTFLLLDPDLIKEYLPEYDLFRTLDLNRAGEMLRHESKDLQTEIFWKALKLRKNLIIDGTLRNVEENTKVISTVRKDFPEYSIEIVFVDAAEATLLERVASRENITQRSVDREFIVSTKRMIRQAVEKLEKLSDVAVEIENETEPRVKRVIRSGVTLDFDVPLAQIKPEHELNRRQFLRELPRSNEGKIKIAFFDADQTLRVTGGPHFYPQHGSDVVLLPFVAEKIKMLQESGYLIAIVSNQGAVSAGKILLSVADSALMQTVRLLEKKGAFIHYFDFADKFDVDRKPMPGMAERLEKKLGELNPSLKIDWKNSLMVGDAGYLASELKSGEKNIADYSNFDRTFAEKIGVRFIHARDFFGWTKYGVKEFITHQDLLEFALHHPELHLEVVPCEFLLH